MEKLVFSSADEPPSDAGEPAVPPNLWDLPVDELPPLLLRPEDVARVLSVSRNKVFVLIRQRELRSVKVGGARRVSAMALRDYVERLDSGDAA